MKLKSVFRTKLRPQENFTKTDELFTKISPFSSDSGLFFSQLVPKLGERRAYLKGEIDVILNRRELRLSRNIDFLELSPKPLRYNLLFRRRYVIHRLEGDFDFF